MQTYKRRSYLGMKRDTELVRTILTKIESGGEFDGSQWFIPKPEELGLPEVSKEQLDYHFMLLIDAGMIRGTLDNEVPVISRLTWQGHEFLDDTRDPDIWEKTKQRARALAGVGIALLWELARAELKHKLHLPN
jgi:hypothetical protein